MMEDQVSWVLELAIKPGELEAFKTLLEEMVDGTSGAEPNRCNEPGACVYERIAWERHGDARDQCPPRRGPHRGGRTVARIRLDNRPPRGPCAGRHRPDRHEARDRRYEPDTAPGEHPARRHLRHQHASALRPLRGQPSLSGRADPRPGTRA